jgi:dTDP-4-dehydrorhamnose reductase
LRDEGVDIRAVTIWSLFGTVDWNSLLTRRTGCYEPGPFDVRGPEPRRTALAHAAEALAKEGAYDHPVLDRAGWWKRDSRFYRPPVSSSNACRLVGSPRRLLITGSTGTLGRAFSRVADHRGLDHVLVSRREMDVADPDSVRASLACHRPWAVINAAGYARVAQAEDEREICFRDNALGAQTLAEACGDLGIPFVTFSSDLVFDGRKGGAYVESDATGATCVYGASKAEAERLVLAAHENALVVRTSAFFGPWDRANFVWSVLNALSGGNEVEAGSDVVSPTYVPDLAHAALDLLIDGAAGLWHLANPGEVSWRDLARRAAQLGGFDADAVTAMPGDPAALNTALTSERGILLPPLESALERFFRDSEVDWSATDPLSVAAE